MAQSPARPKTSVDRLRDVAPQIGDAFAALRRGIDEAGPLTPKYRELINLASFTTARNESGFRTHCGRALEAGATAEEIHQAVLLTFGSNMGIAAVVDALNWADDVISSRK